MSVTVRVTWIDSVTAGVVGTKIYRDDVEIGDVLNGVETFDDDTADDAATYKYEVQAYTSTGESTAEVQGVNVENITTVPDIINKYVFDQSADAYMLADDPSILDGIVEQTFVAWATVRGDNAVNKGIIGTTKSTSLRMMVDGGNLIDNQLNDTGESNVNNCPWEQNETPQQFAFTYDLADMVFYNQGLETKTTASPEFTARNVNRTLVIGQSGALNFNGDITQIHFYNRALTPAELLNLFNDPTNLPTDWAISLKAKWADQKTDQVWTDDISGFTMQNQGGVTTG